MGIDDTPYDEEVQEGIEMLEELVNGIEMAQGSTTIEANEDGITIRVTWDRPDLTPDWGELNPEAIINPLMEEIARLYKESGMYAEILETKITKNERYSADG